VPPLIVDLSNVAYAITPHIDQLTLRWLLRDLDNRSIVLASMIADPLRDQLNAGKVPKSR